MTATNSSRHQNAPGGRDPEALGTFAFKAAIVTIIAAAFVVPLALVAMPYIEFFNDMAVQPKGTAQGLYGRTTGQELIVERLPAPGTIAQSYVPYPLEGTGEGTAVRAGEQLTNPLPATEEAVRRGWHVFKIYCNACHGEYGQGNGPVVGPNRITAPPSLTSDKVADYKDGQIYHYITRGKNTMPTYAEIIPPQDRWAAIHFVRALRYTTAEEEKKEEQE